MATLQEVYKRDLAFDDDFVETPTGDIDSIEGLANYKDAIYKRIITTPGSLIHRPNYGVGIKSFQNSLNSLPQRQRLAVKVKEQCERDPRTNRVIGVQIKHKDETPEQTEILVRVEAVGLGEQTLSFRPFGG